MFRDNCPTSFDPKLPARTFDITRLPARSRAESAYLEGGALHVVWNDQAHQSEFALESLLDFLRCGMRRDPARLQRSLWRSNHATHFQRFSQHDVLNDPATWKAWEHAMFVDGIAVIAEMEDCDAALTGLAETMGLVRPSVSGTHFEVKVHINPVNLAFTANALEIHTNTPTEELAPGIEFLHSRRNTVDGGHSLFPDHAAVAEDFCTEHPRASDLLS